MRPSRREFVKWVTASGIALSLSRLGSAEQTSFEASQTLPGRQGWNPAATGVGRIDGVAKVTGAKLYASDFRAADLPGWPAKTSHAMLVRAPDATHVYAGMDLARLSGALRPSVVVTAEDLAKIGARVPEFYAGDLFCPVGQDAALYGPASGAVDLRDVRRVRSGAAQAPRRHVREIRRGHRPHHAAKLWRVSLYARGRAQRRCPGRLFAGPGRLGQSGLSEQRTAGLAGAARRGRRALCQSGDPWRADSRRPRSEQSRPSGAGPRIRDPIRRSDVSRAGNRPRLVRRRQQESRARPRRAVALRGR